MAERPDEVARKTKSGDPSGPPVVFYGCWKNIEITLAMSYLVRYNGAKERYEEWLQLR